MKLLHIEYSLQPRDFLFLFFAWLPASILTTSFILFELLIALELKVDIGLCSLFFLLISFLVNYYFTLVSASQLTFFKSNSNGKPLQIMDIIFGFSVFLFFIYYYRKFHYVTPSASVLYYIFYDYSRFFHDYGFARPPLPIENPSGTWHSMLTYNPAVGYAVDLLNTSSTFESYRAAFGTFIGITYAGSIAWAGVISRRLIGIFTPGIIVATLVFIFSTPLGLFQSLLLIGSHDTPIIYFCILVLSLSFIFAIDFENQSIQENLMLLITILSVTILGISLRPYLGNLLIGVIILSLIIFYLQIKKFKNKPFSLASVKCHSFIFPTMVLSAGLAWFAILYLKYGVFVVYNHHQHLNSDVSFNAQIDIVKTVLLNNYGGGGYFSIFNAYVAGISLVLGGIFFAVTRKWRAHLILLYLFLLLVSAPILTKTGVHWKTHSPLLVLIYIAMPTIFFSLFLSLKIFKSYGIILLSVFIVLAASYLGQIDFPTKDNDQSISIDQKFRSDVSKLVNPNEKILVLRGGEPGGDSQTGINKYYYWDNIFLYGDVDQYILKNSPNFTDWLCYLKHRGVKYIFNPTTLAMQNHSGPIAFNFVIENLQLNTDAFSPVITRADGYGGTFYKINYNFDSHFQCDN